MNDAVFPLETERIISIVYSYKINCIFAMFKPKNLIQICTNTRVGQNVLVCIGFALLWCDILKS